jgi:hypothetical protein
MFRDKRCYDQSFMNQEFPVAMEDKSNTINKEMTTKGMCCPTMCPPIMECPQERCCHRYICHEVPHVIPCNTRIINHHVYRHTFTPSYTCCEENEYSNVYEPRCC